MKFAVLVATASAWSFSDLGASMGELTRVRINGNELLDLFPKSWSQRIERAVNKVNEMDNDEIPAGIAVAADFIQETMDELND